MPKIPTGWDEENFTKHLEEREAFKIKLEEMGFSVFVPMPRVREPEHLTNNRFPIPPFGRLQEWCMQNCSGRFVVAPDFISVVLRNGDTSGPRNCRLKVVAFENESDAMHFKLRFHNVD